MAYHVRRQIREAVASAVTGLATTGSRVFTSRVYPLEVEDLPCLTVATVAEQSAAIDLTTPATVERRLGLQVTAYARGTADVDDTLDQVCKEVEIALAMPCAALAGLSNSVELTSTEIDLQGSAEQPVGRAAMRFDIVYYVEQNAPDVAH